MMSKMKKMMDTKIKNKIKHNQKYNLKIRKRFHRRMNNMLKKKTRLIKHAHSAASMMKGSIKSH